MSTLTSALPSFNRGKAHCWNPFLASSMLLDIREMDVHQVNLYSVVHLITAAKLLRVATLKPGACQGCQPLPSTQQHLPLSWALELGAQISQSNDCAPTQCWTSGMPSSLPSSLPLHSTTTLQAGQAPLCHRSAPLLQLPAGRNTTCSWGSPNTHLCLARVLGNTPAGTPGPAPLAKVANLARRPL